MMNSIKAYKLRGFEAGNPSDVERMNLMYYHPQVMKAKGYFKREFGWISRADLQESDESMFNILSTISDQHNDVSYAVADELNQLVGWVWFYSDKSHPLPTRVRKELGLTEQNSRVYAVSYEKLMSEGWPDEILNKMVHTSLDELKSGRKGVVVIGLKLALEKLEHDYHRIFSPEHKLVVYGYVNPRNIASRKVLERNGFDKVKRQYRYAKAWHDLWVKII